MLLWQGETGGLAARFHLGMEMNRGLLTSKYYEGCNPNGKW